MCNRLLLWLFLVRLKSNAVRTTWSVVRLHPVFGYMAQVAWLELCRRYRSSVVEHVLKVLILEMVDLGWAFYFFCF